MREHAGLDPSLVRGTEAIVWSGALTSGAANGLASSRGD
jgi:hypothetical protein